MVRTVGISDLLNQPECVPSSRSMSVGSILNPAPAPAPAPAAAPTAKQAQQPPKPWHRPAPSSSAAIQPCASPQDLDHNVQATIESTSPKAVLARLAQDSLVADASDCDFPPNHPTFYNWRETLNTWKWPSPGDDDNNDEPPSPFDRPLPLTIQPTRKPEPRQPGKRRKVHPDPERKYQLVMPAVGGNLLLPVQMQTATKSPYGVRQRNAQASARYRARKRLKAAEDAEKARATVVASDGDLSEIEVDSKFNSSHSDSGSDGDLSETNSNAINSKDTDSEDTDSNHMNLNDSSSDGGLNDISSHNTNPANDTLNNSCPKDACQVDSILTDSPRFDSDSPSED